MSAPFGGLLWAVASDYGRIFRVLIYESLPKRAGMRTRPGVFWLWRRYMMVAIEPARQGSAEWGFKSFETRCLAAYACMREKGVVRFNEAGPGGLINRKAPGTAPLLNADQKQALAKAVEDGPKPYIDGVVRWRIKDLIYWGP